MCQILSCGAQQDLWGAARSWGQGRTLWMLLHEPGQRGGGVEHGMGWLSSRERSVVQLLQGCPMRGLRRQSLLGSWQTGWEPGNRQYADKETAVSENMDSTRDLEFKAGSVFQSNRMRNSEVESKRHGSTSQETRVRNHCGLYSTWDLGSSAHSKAARSSSNGLEQVCHGFYPDRHLTCLICTLQASSVLQNWPPLTSTQDFWSILLLTFLCSRSHFCVSPDNFPAFSISGTSSSFLDSLPLE